MSHRVEVGQQVLQRHGAQAGKGGDDAEGRQHRKVGIALVHILEVAATAAKAGGTGVANQKFPTKT